jgi:hypothetical protein
MIFPSSGLYSTIEGKMLKLNECNVAFLLIAGVFTTLETAVAKERLCKHNRCYAVAQWL